MESRESDGLAWSAFGAIAAIAVAGLLVPVRSTIDNTNVALILVLVVVAAATFGGRTAGAVTSIVSALAFNYFQTEPFYTLRISDRDDIVSAVLLLVVGLAVGEIAVLAAAAPGGGGRARDGGSSARAGHRPPRPGSD